MAVCVCTVPELLHVYTLPEVSHYLSSQPEGKCVPAL